MTHATTAIQKETPTAVPALTMCHVERIPIGTIHLLQLSAFAGSLNFLIARTSQYSPARTSRLTMGKVKREQTRSAPPLIYVLYVFKAGARAKPSAGARSVCARLLEHGTWIRQ
jgi:hypothetical protein